MHLDLQHTGVCMCLYATKNNQSLQRPQHGLVLETANCGNILKKRFLGLTV